DSRFDVEKLKGAQKMKDIELAEAAKKNVELLLAFLILNARRLCSVRQVRNSQVH
ncbi:hypothetical protein BIFBRE_05082, partial [Bifidobacterium breve DSM 20213 = JCM 1192]